MVQLSATRCSCVAILWVSLVSFATITLCVASRRVVLKVSVYFVTDSVRKLLVTPSYLRGFLCSGIVQALQRADLPWWNLPQTQNVSVTPMNFKLKQAWKCYEKNKNSGLSFEIIDNPQQVCLYCHLVHVCLFVCLLTPLITSSPTSIKLCMNSMPMQPYEVPFNLPPWTTLSVRCRYPQTRNSGCISIHIHLSYWITSRWTGIVGL
jgi:hypothetical protein